MTVTRPPPCRESWPLGRIGESIRGGDEPAGFGVTAPRVPVADGRALAASPRTEPACIGAPPPPMEARAAFPPTGRVRRRRFALIRDTRHRLATCRSLSPALISSAAGQPHPLPAGPLRRERARRERDISCLRHRTGRVARPGNPAIEGR
jgi:hypothetical protein